jgi:hypothetical protein
MQAQSSSKRSSRVRKSKADHILTNDQDSESEGKDPPASRPKLQKQLDSTLAADRAVDVESKPRREKTDKLSEKENFPGVVEKSLAKVSDEGTKAPIMLGSLINPEAFQKIRANFSLPKLKK